MLHEFASHLGLCFQIRDDLLDVQGETEIIGKPVGSDERNKKATFVTVMGERKAEQRLYRELEGALECLQKMDQDTMYLENIANYIVHRAH
jgi:geranylgeranyl pyrophosphate synthase